MRIFNFQFSIFNEFSISKFSNLVIGISLVIGNWSLVIPPHRAQRDACGWVLQGDSVQFIEGRKSWNY